MLQTVHWGGGGVKGHAFNFIGLRYSIFLIVKLLFIGVCSIILIIKYSKYRMNAKLWWLLPILLILNITRDDTNQIYDNPYCFYKQLYKTYLNRIEHLNELIPQRIG